MVTVLYGIVLTGCIFSLDAMPQLPGFAKFKVTDLQSCETTGTAIPFEGGLITLSNGDKAFSATFTLTSDITDEFTFTVVMNKWVTGKWEMIYEKEGPVFEYVKEIFPRAWEKLSAHSNPLFDSHIDLLPAGEYTITEYQIEQSDINLPGTMYGKLKAEYRLYNAEDENIFCRILEVDSS